ncbi:ferritin-like domain-containing protein [Methylocaldum sp.]|uniref:ferritin-like domain-containing protein n=1 Tax=Methylocaldum sp. TaxID=1969727 RepID=UPI002D703612|nr:ferritin-like domain-containing protein [Methylocaldum sp.]HYE34249.1 ferritin-like domain-containing protein [Methylocaldum sp.]
MPTLIGNEDSFIDTLTNLIELDFDAVAAYEAAIKRLDDGAIGDQLGQFMSDHQRHIQELSHIVRDLGRVPPIEADFKAVLTQGKVIIGNIAGDKGILQAMKSNEDDTNQAYSQALQRTDILPQARPVLQRNLADERRHRAWIEERLARM